MTARALWLALLLIAALWLASLAAYRTPVSKPIEAPDTQFSGERAKAVLRRLLGDELPHPIGSAANARVRTQIIAELRALGIEPLLQTGLMVCGRYGHCGTPTNIIARLAGTEEAQGGSAADNASTAHAASAVLLAAHYDSVPAGPGASDDGAGVAAVLEIARALQRLPRPRHSIILLLDDGEEAGLLGAEAFVQHPWARSVAAAVNLDARGTSGPSLMFETGSANRWLMSLYARAVRRPLTNSVYYAAYKSMPNDTDFSVFRAAGYQGFNFAFIGDVMHYHTRLDDWRHVEAGSIQHQGEMALSVLRVLANEPIERPPTGEALYFDLLGRGLVRIPQTWALPAALCLLPLLGWTLTRLASRQQLRWRALLWGIVGLAAALVIGGAATTGLLGLMGSLAPPSPYSWVAHPWALELSFAALAFWISAVLAARLTQLSGYWGLWCACALINALLGVGLAAWLPGASYLLLLPAVAAWLALALCAAASREGRPAPAAVLATVGVCAVSFALLLPVVVPLYGALGSRALPLLSVLLICGCFNLMALHALAGATAQRALSAGAALCIVAGVCAALLLPRYSPEAPQRLNLMYLLDGDSRRAHWLVDAAVGRLPGAWSQAAPFEVTAQPVYAWSAAPMFLASAPWLDLRLPQVKVLSATCAAGRAHYQIDVSSGRAAPVLSLLFPPHADIDGVVLGGEATVDAPAMSVHASPVQLGHGWSRLQLLTLPAQGASVSFDADQVAFDLHLLDQSFGLPPQGRELQQRRPADTVVSQDGDVTQTMRSVRLGGCLGSGGDGPS